MSSLETCVFWVVLVSLSPRPHSFSVTTTLEHWLHRKCGSCWMSALKPSGLALLFSVCALCCLCVVLFHLSAHFTAMMWSAEGMLLFSCLIYFQMGAESAMRYDCSVKLIYMLVYLLNMVENVRSQCTFPLNQCRQHSKPDVYSWESV